MMERPLHNLSASREAGAKEQALLTRMDELEALEKAAEERPSSSGIISEAEAGKQADISNPQQQERRSAGQISLPTFATFLFTSRRPIFSHARSQVTI